MSKPLINTEWQGQAVPLLLQYISENKKFTAEQAWEWCFLNGLPQPANSNSLGSFWRSIMLKKGEAKLKPCGITNATKASSKGTKTSLYISLLYKGEELESFQEKIAKLKTKFKFREITLDEYTDYLWGLFIDTVEYPDTIEMD